MTQPTPEPNWKEEAPDYFQIYIKEFANLADLALKNGSPFHSVRVAKRVIKEAGREAGRVMGWVISSTTEQGWEYENTTLDDEGSFWFLFKNPYVFS